MTNKDAQALAEKLLAAYPQTHVREQTPSLYARYLTDLDVEATKRVIGELIATQRMLPTIAEIRGQVAQEALELPTPWEAWQSVSGRGHEIHDLAKRAAELFGGTYNIRTSESTSIIRSQFLKAYEELRDHELRRASLRGLRKSA